MEADQIVDPPPPKQMRKISVQAGNGEDIIDNYLNTANPILMPCSNETDIFFQLMKSSPEYNNLQYGLACAMK
jgi:hypothetical protein